MGRRIHPGVIDFTHTPTVYRAKIKTFMLKVKQEVYGTYLLRTFGGEVNVESLLRAILEQYDEDREHMVMLILSPAREVMGYKRLASGSEDRVETSRKIIFRHALMLGASAIILAHNHPNGDLRPSSYDLHLTQLVVEGSKLIEIELMDHFIVGPPPNCTCASIREQAPEIFPAQPIDRDEGKEG
jgi:DNA repair protein RadC